jgi:hypothetical protein
MFVLQRNFRRLDSVFWCNTGAMADTTTPQNTPTARSECVYVEDVDIAYVKDKQIPIWHLLRFVNLTLLH